MAAVNLNSGAISKIMTGRCTDNDLKPVLQVTFIKSCRGYTKHNKQWYWVVLSDGLFKQLGLIAEEILKSNKLQTGDIVQLNQFLLIKGGNDIGEIKSNIQVSDLTVIHSNCDIIGDPKLYPLNETPLVERTTFTIPDEDHVNSHHVEEPPTSKHNTPASTPKCSFHSLALNQKNTIMGVNLTPGAITKIMTDKCSSTDLRPVVQATNILNCFIWIGNKKDKQCYRKVLLSDGSSSHFGCIIHDIFMSNKLQKGSIIQLTKFHFTKFSTGDMRVLVIDDLNVIHSKCDIIVNPEPFPCNDIPLLERSTPPITDEDHVNVSQAQEHVTSTQNCSETQSKKRKDQSSDETPKPDTNDDVYNSQNAQEPSATTQKCSSHSLARSKKRKHQSSNDNITKVVEEVCKMTKMMMEKNKQDDVGACFKKLETLEEDVSKMARMMTPRNKEDGVGACFKKLETLENDISKVSRTIMEKNKEDDVGACFKKLETLEEDVSKMARVMTENNKEDDVGACFKKLETLEKDISKVSRTIMEKNKEDDVGVCFKKLEILEEVVSKLTRMMIEKNKQDDVGACLEKLWILEEDVSKLTRMMIEKNKEDDVCSCSKKLETLEKDISKLTSDGGACFKKLETLEEDVSKFTRMIMEKNKEDDMGACIEKLDRLGWGAEEPIYDTALLLFGQSADYRKLWLHLKPESCGKWVKNAGNMFGLLD